MQILSRSSRARAVIVALLMLATACGDSGGSGGLDPAPDAESADVAPLDGGDVNAEVDATDDPSDADEDGQASDAGDVGPDAIEEDVADTDEPCTGIGCACEEDADCGLGLCIPAGPAGEGICSEYCDRAGECPNGYDCRLYVNSSGDAVSFCVPDSQWCAPCSPADLLEDCGGLGYDCGEVDDGQFCMPEALDGRCADGWRARLGDDGRTFCYPELNVCSPCFDPDDDGFGVGLDCAGADCDEGSATAYPGAPELCDGIDNDCDLSVDEGFDTTSDPLNCGACGFVCAVDGASAACVSGRCVVAECEPGVADCDADSTTGCETVLSGGCLGCDDLAREGDACGLCGEGALVCVGDGTLECDTTETATELNPCGGCTALTETPGSDCGTCGLGTWECNDDGSAVECVDASGEPLLNACGGCTDLATNPGEACGTCQSGVTECDGTDAVRCVGDDGDAALNACGGCGTLLDDVGAACGACGTGFYICAGGELACDDSDSTCRLFVWFRQAPHAWRATSPSYRVSLGGAAPVGARGSSANFFVTPFPTE